MIENSLPRLLGPSNVQPWARQLIDDLNVRLRSLTQAKVTSADSQYGYLSSKIVAGSNVSINVLNSGGDEQLEISSSAVGVGVHDFLSSEHSDTLAAAVTRGALVYGNSTPKWAKLSVGTGFLKADGTDVTGWATLTDADIPNTITLDNLTQISTRSHASLQNLTADDHPQYLLLVGRSGTTNDPLLSTTGTTGTIYGTAINQGTLALRGSQNPSVTENETVLALSKIRVAPDFSATQIGGVDFAFYDAGGNTTYQLVDMCTIEALIQQTGLNLKGNVRAMRGVHLRSNITNDDGITSDLGPFRAYNNVIRYTPGTGSSMVNLGTVGVSQSPLFDSTGTGNTITGQTGVLLGGSLGSTWAATDWRVGLLIPPQTTGTPGGIARLGGLELRDYAPFVSDGGTIDAAYSLWTKGGYFMAHEGPALFGAAQSTLTAPAASAILELSHATKALLLTRAAGTGGIATPVNGMLHYDSTANKVTARENGAWVSYLTATEADALFLTPAEGNAAYQPLDTDLSEIAGLANARGDLLITNSTPAWARFVIGAAKTYVRSDGTDPAYAQVTELGTVTEYGTTPVTLAGVGLPHIVAVVNATGQTANIGLTTLYTPGAAGYYRVSVYMSVTTVAGTSSTMPDFNLVWTDGVSGAGMSSALITGAAAPVTPQAGPPGAPANKTNNTTTVFRAATAVIYASAAAISYSTSVYASNPAATMQYQVRVRLEAL